MNVKCEWKIIWLALDLFCNGQTVYGENIKWVYIYVLEIHRCGQDDLFWCASFK